MIIITDDVGFSGKYFSDDIQWMILDKRKNNVNDILIDGIFSQSADLYFSQKIDSSKDDDIWKYLLMVEHAEESQYDKLIRLAQQGKLPEGILCIAGSGKKFHGFHNRSWESLPGNIHLSAYLKPNKEIKNFAACFLMLSTVSVVMAIDDMDELRGKASIKWVNDILIDSAKVSGVLAHTMVQDNNVTDVVLGIGLNVESNPFVAPTPYVPTTACLNDFTNTKITEGQIFDKLVGHLANNYKLILDGKYNILLNFYRDRSNILGQEVAIMNDDLYNDEQILHQGIVTGIGENLELYFDNSYKPVTKGRLILI